MTKTAAPTELATKDGFYPIVKARRMIDGRYRVTFRMPDLDGLWVTTCDAQGRKDGYAPVNRAR